LATLWFLAIFLVPGILALALPMVKPAWVAWVLWGIAAAIAAWAWFNALSTYPGTERVFYMAYAIWLTLWPIVALAIWYFSPRRKLNG
jgi:hypothetical protein